MLRGICSASIDTKGRMAVPTRHRDRLVSPDSQSLILTLNPWDRCLWLYPEPEWTLVEEKLQALPDFDLTSRRTKQIMRGHAIECALDGQGRILLPGELREFAAIERQVVVLGQGNKCEIWDLASWNKQRDEWLAGVVVDGAPPSTMLGSLSL
ncbi:MAG: division/cell wall cluster transcriptional repressor MraZ [Gammaproteobacteria bacterium]|nr:division/cell wall cluster transcriptional repressor MraZ [Gammaproteobacteria bacterium]